MCGIAGLFDYDPNHTGHVMDSRVDVEIGRRMVDSLLHRGPDDGGLAIFDRLMIGHRRLSILDLSDDGHQPMRDAARGAWLTFNGEIYNYRQLRQELVSLGHVFRSQTDTEVILRGYVQWGRDVVHRLSGMFAFAVWDDRARELWVVRDPVGIKPLFYHDDRGCFRFGSEIKAILADPRVERRVDWNAIQQFLALGYTPAPLTGFAGVLALLPGHELIISSQGVRCERYYQWPYPDRPSGASMEQAADELGAAIDDAVRRQIVSDVPVGAFLSGGLDSSAVVRSMTRAGAAVRTFTIGFGDSSFDESPYAQQVAEIFGSEHHAARATEDLSSLLQAVIAHTEMPFADNSALPFFMLCEATRRHVKVALSGDGADELLAGYSTYRATQLAVYLRRVPRPIRRHVLSPLCGWMPASGKKYSARMLAGRFLAGADEPFPRDHCSWRRMIYPPLAGLLFRGELAAAAQDDPLAGYVRAVQSGPDWLSREEQALHGDLTFHLPNDMLLKVDRMSMAHSLEVRVPLLDEEVIRTCLRIPYALKRQGNSGKRVLKKLLAQDLPPRITHRKKSGFLVPIEKWLAGPWQALLHEHLGGRFIEATGALDRQIVSRMVDQQRAGKADHAYPLFALLMLALWWETWIDQSQPTQRLIPVAKPTRLDSHTQST